LRDSNIELEQEYPIMSDFILPTQYGTSSASQTINSRFARDSN
jgi:hypothetical protein